MGHLGGYTADDPLTYYPKLWDWLADGTESVLDVGAGEGRAAKYFESLGLETLAVDGVGGPGIVRWDFRDGPAPISREFDLCWSCEFVEHVEEEFVENILEAFAYCQRVVMSHALPGQGGHHHVNCQRASYWIARLGERGFYLAAEASLIARELAALDSLEGYFVRTGLVFGS